MKQQKHRCQSFLKSICHLLAVSALALVYTTSCATLSKMTGGAKPEQPKPISDGSVTPQVAGDAIVMQPTSKSPLISSKDNNYWVTLRSKGKDELSRMRGQLATGDWQSAVTSGKAYLMTHPDQPEAMMGLASAFALGKRYEMAGYYASQVLKVQTSNSDAMNIIGLRIMMATGNRRADYQDAINWFQKSMDADGTQIAAGLNLGHLQMELGLTSNATEVFSTTARRCGDCNSGLMGLGISSARAKRGQDAKLAFEKILSRDAFHAEAKYQLAMNYRNNLGDSNKAAKLLQDIVSDAEGHYSDDMPVKRQANIALRRIRATDRTGSDMKVRGGLGAGTNAKGKVKAPAQDVPDAVAAPFEDSDAAGDPVQ